MSEHDEHDEREQPETAVEEVLREVEEAGRHAEDSAGRRHRGEAGDAVTPNTEAQEQSHGE
ncbi:hypothetical protein GCM10010294_16040 [Streptomyces griseoloalbus]|uniref:hypothetical protein n=1 Tax=Streptomyces griseoloalbus TaxID=67303 RepID=UPI0018761110|nr:hypothetical protein GCM10010294_16040 [Streptomyces griseoloalbus]